MTWEHFIYREAAAYGELLETMKNLVDEEQAEVSAEVIVADPPTGANGQPRSPAQEQDLLAAGLMSGVDDVPEAQLLAMASDADAGAPPDVDGLRELLCHALGRDAFEQAHARLQNVVEEEDDDALVHDIQAILGPKRLDKLPMILKLIFLEGGATA